MYVLVGWGGGTHFIKSWLISAFVIHFLKRIRAKRFTCKTAIYLLVKKAQQAGIS